MPIDLTRIHEDYFTATGALFAKKPRTYWYKDSHYKPKTVGDGEYYTCKVMSFFVNWRPAYNHNKAIAKTTRAFITEHTVYATP